MARWRNSRTSYGIVAQSLHWLIAAVVLVQFALGVYAANLPVSLARLQWLTRHKSVGLAILALMLLRLAWGGGGAPPPGHPGTG
ncbi:MAG: cytochrome b, partial [Burkholderiaceae bacterium]